MTCAITCVGSSGSAMARAKYARETDRPPTLNMRPSLFTTYAAKAKWVLPTTTDRLNILTLQSSKCGYLGLKTDFQVIFIKPN
jgi:TorA maturation chaperone TorD